MVKSEQKRQQKLARKQAKDRKRHHQESQKRQQSVSLHGQMLQSAAGSIVYCGASPQIQGMANVIFARRAPNGLIGMMCLLVDTYCLGVKNVVAGVSDADHLREIVEQTNAIPCEPSVARGLVESAIEFANQAGLLPHADYRNVQPLWGSVDRASIEGLYEMGKDGKHVYVNGPFDNRAKQSRILATLKTNLGEGNYNVVLMMNGADLGMHDFDEDDMELENTLENVEHLRLTQ